MDWNISIPETPTGNAFSRDLNYLNPEAFQALRLLDPHQGTALDLQRPQTPSCYMQWPIVLLCLSYTGQRLFKLMIYTGHQYFWHIFHAGQRLFCSTIWQIFGPVPTINTERSLKGNLPITETDKILNKLCNNLVWKRNNIITGFHESYGFRS